jgi:hypothetical protein
MRLFVALVVLIIIDCVIDGVSGAYERLRSNRLILVSVVWVLFWNFTKIISLIFFDARFIPLPEPLLYIFGILDIVFCLVAFCHLAYSIVTGH